MSYSYSFSARHKQLTTEQEKKVEESRETLLYCDALFTVLCVVCIDLLAFLCPSHYLGLGPKELFLHHQRLPQTKVDRHCL